MSLGIEKSLKVENLDKVLDEIRPHLETDGGDIKVVSIDADGMVSVELLGNCQSCTLSGMTLRNGVEQILKSHYPGIKGVIAVNQLKNNE